MKDDKNPELLRRQSTRPYHEKTGMMGDENTENSETSECKTLS